jgi:hypothetical protein
MIIQIFLKIFEFKGFSWLFPFISDILLGGVLRGERKKTESGTVSLLRRMEDV